MPNNFSLPFFVAAALAVPLAPGHAQTKPAQQHDQNVPKPIRPGEPAATEGSSGMGAAVGTQQPSAEMLQHVQASGYSQVQVTPDSARGGWSGTAQKSGKQVKLHIAPNGNLSSD